MRSLLPLQTRATEMPAVRTNPSRSAIAHVAHPYRVAFGTAAVLFGILLTGCTSSKERYLADGKKYYQEKKYQEAGIALRKVLAADFNSAEAAYYLGLTELERGQDLTAAVTALRRAVSLNPANVDARTKLADIFFGLYAESPERPRFALEEATGHARYLVTNNPKSFDGLRITGNLRLLEGKLDEALDLFAKAQAVKPHDPVLVVSYMQALERAGKKDESEKLAVETLERVPDATTVYDMLAQYYVRTNRIGDAEKIYQRKVAAQPKNSFARQQLALHYLRANKAAESKAVLDELLSRPADFPRALLEVGDFHRDTGNVVEAMVLYDKAAQVAGLGEEAAKRKASVFLSQGKNQEAAALYQQVSSSSPKDREAAINKAILRIETDVPGAIKEMRELVQSMPDNALLRYSLGRALLLSGDVGLASFEFREAVRRQRFYVAPRLALAELSLEGGQYAEALQHANDVLGIDANNSAARLFRSAGLTGIGNLVEARQELNRLTREYPDYRDAQIQMALLLIAEKNPSEARAVLEKVRRAAPPTDLRPLLGLAEISIAQGEPEKALEFLQQEVTRNPKSVPLRMSLARTAFRLGNFSKAAEEYNALSKTDPRPNEVFTRLGEVQYRMGDYTNAVVTFQTARTVLPQDEEVQLFLGVSFEALGRKDEAVRIYRNVLAKRPNSALALNNLAYLLSADDSKLDEAFALSQRALQQLPKEATFMDTMGWIYHRKKQTPAALQVFDKLVRDQPSNPDFLYHHGAALAAAGRKPEARKQLEAALRSGPKGPEAEEIKKLLSTL